MEPIDALIKQVEQYTLNKFVHTINRQVLQKNIKRNISYIDYTMSLWIHIKGVCPNTDYTSLQTTYNDKMTLSIYIR